MYRSLIIIETLCGQPIKIKHGKHCKHCKHCKYCKHCNKIKNKKFIFIFYLIDIFFMLLLLPA